MILTVFLLSFSFFVNVKQRNNNNYTEEEFFSSGVNTLTKKSQDFRYYQNSIL